MKKRRHNKIILENGKELSFYGEYLGHFHPDTPEKERKNWHYYQEENGTIYHIRKDSYVACVESYEEQDDANAPTRVSGRGR